MSDVQILAKKVTISTDVMEFQEEPRRTLRSTDQTDLVPIQTVANHDYMEIWCFHRKCCKRLSYYY